MIEFYLEELIDSGVTHIPRWEPPCMTPTAKDPEEVLASRRLTIDSVSSQSLVSVKAATSLADASAVPSLKDCNNSGGTSEPLPCGSTDATSSDILAMTPDGEHCSCRPVLIDDRDNRVTCDVAMLC